MKYDIIKSKITADGQFLSIYCGGTLPLRKEMTKIIGTPTLDDAFDVLAELVEKNEARGERTLVFCEDRLTLLAEQAVLSVNGGTFLTEVSTFRRFIGTGAGRKNTISKQGSVLKIAALLSSYADELKCFGKNSAQAVYETIAQLSASCVTVELLEKSAAEAGGLLGRKLSDLALLFRQYKKFLAENELLDENGYLALLPEQIRSGKLENVNVVFFAFPSFTRQACKGIRAAIAAARSVTGVFLSGREEFYTNEAARIFRKTAEACGEVFREMRNSSLAGEARVLHRALFSVDRAIERLQTDHVRIMTPCDESEEMNAVAALIVKLTAEGKRYRDIAVLCGGEQYLLATRKAFNAYQIPYYSDIKRKFSQHPFCVFLLSVLEGVADGVLPDEADGVASSVYFGAGDNYRNYLLRYGAYRGGYRREIKGEEELGGAYGDRSELVECRARLASIFSLFKNKATGEQYAEGVRALWRLVDGDRVTEELSRKVSEDDRAFLDISPLESVLTETERIVGGEQFGAREFAALLRSAFEALAISVLPQYADAVFVGDISESRIYRSDVLICTGLTDDLPRVSQDTAIITDGEIKALSALEVEIDPAIAVVNARARETLALNLCSFSETLILSRPLRKGGVEAVASEIFYDVDRAFSVASMSELFPYDCSRFAPAMLAYYTQSEAYATTKGEQSAEEVMRRYSSLRALLMQPQNKEWQPIDPELMRADRQKAPTLEAGELWLGRDVSPTLLENYFECPYKSFAERALRVSDREERTLLDAADAGSFVHTVLERSAASFNQIGSEEECRTLARSIAESLLASPYYAAVGDTAAGQYSGGRLIDESEAVVCVAYRQLKESEYRVHQTEAEIRLEELGLRGKTDRVDQTEQNLVRVIDYKTGSIDATPVAYYTGRKLQLQLYLQGAAKSGVAAGAFYFPAVNDFRREEEPAFKMKGFFCNEPQVVRSFDPTCAEGEKSEFFESGSRDKGLSQEDFNDFLGYAKLVAEGAETEMREGNIAPSPYDGACDYCKLKGMCGFTGGVRKEEKVSCAEIVKIVRETRTNMGSDGKEGDLHE